MKTTQTLMLMLMLLVVSLAREAQAFYNPSTGRWLSRDPMGENGGQNIYTFLQNSAQNTTDSLGLCDDGICGKDVTSPVNKVLDEVSAKFDSWSPVDQGTACEHLISGGYVGGNITWDIKEMKFLGKTDLEGCERQATFQDRCYYGSAINYAMFGRAVCKCHNAFPYRPQYTLTATIAGVIWHKMHSRGGYWGNEEAMQAVPFTIYGWNYGSGSSTTGPLWPHFSCAPDTTPDARNFHWMWQPLKQAY